MTISVLDASIFRQNGNSSSTEAPSFPSIANFCRADKRTTDILRCLLCNSWDRHEEFTTPHQICKNLRERGFSISPTEHPHLRQPWDIQLFPVWAHYQLKISCTECHFNVTTNISRMPETIITEIESAINSLQRGLFYNENTLTPCTLRSCKVCPIVISDYIGPHNCHFKSTTNRQLIKIIIVSIKCFFMDKLVFVFSLMNTTVK